VESLRQEMVQRHDQASKRMTQAMLEAAQVLTPEQRTKLAEAMKERRARKDGHRHSGEKGHGAEGGPGHGHHGKEGERKAS
jgi:Spy/CpxP family protein refolding chaperone